MYGNRTLSRDINKPGEDYVVIIAAGRAVTKTEMLVGELLDDRNATCRVGYDIQELQNLVDSEVDISRLSRLASLAQE
jgi:hypothetical protein